MSFLKNVTRGGQLQIYQLRMFHQIANFAFVISFVIAMLFCIIKINKDLPSKQMRQSLDYLKADYIVSFSNIVPKIEATQLVILKGREVRVSSRDILRSSYYIKVYVHTKQVIKSNIGYGILVI